jgi:hypothetical protein
VFSEAPGFCGRHEPRLNRPQKPGVSEDTGFLDDTGGLATLARAGLGVIMEGAGPPGRA